MKQTMTVTTTRVVNEIEKKQTTWIERLLLRNFDAGIVIRVLEDNKQHVDHK